MLNNSLLTKTTNHTHIVSFLTKYRYYFFYFKSINQFNDNNNIYLTAILSSINGWNDILDHPLTSTNNYYNALVKPFLQLFEKTKTQYCHHQHPNNPFGESESFLPILLPFSFRFTLFFDLYYCIPGVFLHLLLSW